MAAEDYDLSEKLLLDFKMLLDQLRY